MGEVDTTLVQRATTEDNLGSKPPLRIQRGTGGNVPFRRKALFAAVMTVGAVTTVGLVITIGELYNPSSTPISNTLPGTDSSTYSASWQWASHSTATQPTSFNASGGEEVNTDSLQKDKATLEREKPTASDSRRPKVAKLEEYKAPTVKKGKKRTRISEVAKVEDYKVSQPDNGSKERQDEGNRTKIREFPFPPMKFQEYERIMKPAKALYYLSHSHKLELDQFRRAALDMDAVRRKLPSNAISKKIPVPDELNTSTETAKDQNFLWGSTEFRNKLKEWYKEQCSNYTPASPVNLSSPVVKDIESLVQRSFVLRSVSYNDELDEPVFSQKGKALEYPYCDVRKCPQQQYPFIYLVVANRNRVKNLVQFILSVRNATLRCDTPPPWFHCLCIYVSDYDTDIKARVANELDVAWRDRVRLLSRAPATSPWTRTQTYNSALRHIPTPSERSLIFHVDTDIVATDPSFIDRALQGTQLGKQVAFPIVMGTTGKIKDGDAFFQAVVDGTLWNKGNTWVRAGGYGMTWFYLYDNNVGFFGSTINKTTWGGEDGDFFGKYASVARGKQMKYPSRYKDESLWHIWHKQFMNWKKSKDGISIDSPILKKSVYEYPLPQQSNSMFHAERQSQIETLRCLLDCNKDDEDLVECERDADKRLK